MDLNYWHNLLLKSPSLPRGQFPHKTNIFSMERGLSLKGSGGGERRAPPQGVEVVYEVSPCILEFLNVFQFSYLKLYNSLNFLNLIDFFF